MSNKKNIIVIGGGISGLTCGIYALANGFNVTILEKHNIVGGQCTGWMRENAYIDGCAHWIVGTNKNSQLFPLWKFIGAFDENTKIYETEYFHKIDIDGEIVTIYSDLDLLYKELLRLGPDDEKIIKKLIKGCKRYQSVSIPVDKPFDMMNIFEYALFGLKLLPMGLTYRYATKITIEEFASKCKSDLLRKTIERTLYKDYNMHSLYYVMQALSKVDAGMVEGGSLKMVMRIKDRFLKLGGVIKTNCNVEKINISNNLATGVTLDDGSVINADYVVSTCDIHHTLYNLLDNKYDKPFFKEKFSDLDKHPLSLGVLASFKYNSDVCDFPKMLCFKIKPFNIGKTIIDEITVRNYNFDKTLSKGYTTLSVLIKIDNDVYDLYNNMTDDEYIEEKNRIGNILLDEIIKYYKVNPNMLSFIDLTTPLTYERYTNAYRGSYMSFITTGAQKTLMDDGKIKGVDNLFLAGQWIMPPGGLPIALFTGKHAAIRICKREKKKFISEKNYNN